MENLGYTKLLFEDATLVGDKLYCILRDFNILISIEICTGKIELINSIPEGTVFSYRLGSKIIYNNGFLYFAPMNAKKIWRYDLNNRVWKGYERKVIDGWTGSEEMFQAILYKDKIFYIGSMYPSFIVFDTVNEEIKYIDEMYNKKKDLVLKEKDCFFRKDYVLLKNKLYISSCIDNEILEFNMDNYEYKYHKVGNSELRYSGIAFGDRFVLSARNTGHIVFWNIENNDVDTIKAIDVDKECLTFGGAISKNDFYDIWALEGDYSVRINKNNSIVEMIDEKYLFYDELCDDFYVSLSDRGILVIENYDKHIEYKMEIENQLLYNYISKHKSIYLCNEDEIHTLEMFINIM